MLKRYAGQKITVTALGLILTVIAFTTDAYGENLEINVSSSKGWPLSGIKVYAFTESGAYTGYNKTTDTNGIAVFDADNFTQEACKFRVDYMSGQFWSDLVSLPQASSTAVVIEEDDVQVSVTNGNSPISGLKVYLFTSSGAYLGKNETTDDNGPVTFIVPVGMPVKFRADNLGYQFWSDPTMAASVTQVDLVIPYQPLKITVNGIYQGAADPLTGIKVYLFTPSGSYLGQYMVTDSNGHVTFDLPQRAYKARADFMGRQFWSAAVTAPDTAVDIPMADAWVTVTGAGLPLEGVTVYVFTRAGSYLGINGKTDASGQVTFRLPAGDYTFRSDYQGSQYWSVEQTLAADQVNPVAISTGGGAFSFTILKGADDPLGNVNCYVFTETGSYLGITAPTDIDGQVVFNLTDGRYKIRVDYLGYQIWSPVYEVPTVLSDTFIIDHTNVDITVNGLLQDVSIPLEGIKVYLFTPAGSYLGLSETTDSNGQVGFNLPGQPYTVRCDYLSQQYWSAEFTAQDTTVNIPMVDAGVNVSWNSQALEDIPVYVFTHTGSYLGLTDRTDPQGDAFFQLPAATYKFRADYLGSRYWSGEEALQAGAVNSINIFTGGGTFDLTILKDLENPLVGDKTYLFNPSGSYLGIADTTDEHGQVSFDLPQGSYQFRIDTLGYRFWTEVYDLPEILDDEFTIPHQDVTITVQGMDPDPTPLEGLNVYLFTPSDSYLGLKLVTDSNGRVVFNLPEKDYKVRADFLGYRFWSEVFQWQDTTLPIYRASAELDVHLGGTDIVGARVYLFSESGAYLGRYETTDENGKVQFLLPDRPFKFRIDHDGGQYWSDGLTVAVGQTNTYDIDLLPPAVSISAVPAAIPAGAETTLTWHTTNAYSCSIDPDIGQVEGSGSIKVSPDQSTTYTITATGPGGSITESVEVAVGTAFARDFIDIIIDHSKIDENLTDFPVLVKLSANSGTNGFDAAPVLNALMPDIDPNDDFSGSDGDVPNSDLWTSNGYPDYVSIRSGKLNVKVNSIDSWNTVHSKNTFWLAGDFDIQVDYEIVTGPSTSRWHGLLAVYNKTGLWSRIDRFYNDAQNGHGYRHHSYNGNSYATEGLVNQMDTSGKLRLTRSGASFKSYAWYNDQWNLIGTSSNYNSTEDLYIQVGASVGADKPYAELNFDNFQINSGSAGSVKYRHKFAVYDSEGRQCYTEIEKWDAVNKEALLWVSAPQVSSTTNTKLEMHFDKNFRKLDLLKLQLGIRTVNKS